MQRKETRIDPAHPAQSTSRTAEEKSTSTPGDSTVMCPKKRRRAESQSRPAKVGQAAGSNQADAGNQPTGNGSTDTSVMNSNVREIYERFPNIEQAMESTATLDGIYEGADLSEMTIEGVETPENIQTTVDDETPSNEQPEEKPTDDPYSCFAAVDEAESIVAELARLEELTRLGESTRQQFAQLATYLRRRQEMLDHREADINARLARIDRDARVARLWLTEREQELGQLESSLQKRGEALDAAHRDLQARTDELADERTRFDLEHKAAVESFESEQSVREANTQAERKRLAEMQARLEKFDDEIRRRENAVHQAEEDIVRRQSALAAQEAEAERLRSSWTGREETVRKNEEELEQRDAAMRELEADISEREAKIVEREKKVEERQAELDRASSAVGVRQTALTELESEWGRRIEEFQQSKNDLDRRHHTITQIERTLEKRIDEIDHLQTELRSAISETESVRVQLIRDREQLENETREMRRELAEQQGRHMAEIEQKRTDIRNRSEQLDQANAQLEHDRVTISDWYHKTLECRCVVEQLWSELCGVATPNTLSKAAKRFQQQLAEHFRRTEADIERQNRKIEAARKRLDSQIEDLQHRRRRVEVWVEESRATCQKQIDELQVREKQLNQREAAMVDQRRQWEIERLRLHEQRIASRQAAMKQNLREEEQNEASRKKDSAGTKKQQESKAK